MNRVETISLSGDLNSPENQSQMNRILEEKWENGVEILNIDFTEVGIMNFDVFTELMAAKNRFEQAGTTISFLNFPKKIRTLIELFKIPMNASDS